MAGRISPCAARISRIGAEGSLLHRRTSAILPTREPFQFGSAPERFHLWERPFMKPTRWLGPAVLLLLTMVAACTPTPPPPPPPPPPIAAPPAPPSLYHR